MGPQAKNSTFFENIQDRTLFLRKISQENHVKRMNLARKKGENLQANFIKPSNFSKIDSKLKAQNDSVNDSNQKPIKRTENKVYRRSPNDKGRSSKVIRNKVNDLRVSRKKLSPFVLLNTTDKSRRTYCFPDENEVDKYLTRLKVETHKKYNESDKSYKKKFTKEKYSDIKSYREQSTDNDIKVKDEINYQLQKAKKPLKNMMNTTTKRKLKSKIPELAYEQESRYLKVGLCKGYINSITCFDATKEDTSSPKISRPSRKGKVSRNANNLKFKKAFRESPTLEMYRKPSGDNIITLLNECTQTDLTGKKCTSSEINLCVRPRTKIRSSSLDPLDGKRIRNRKEEQPQVPHKSKIPIAITRIKQFKDDGSGKQLKKVIYKFERDDPVPKTERHVNRKSLHDKFTEKQKAIESAIEKGCFQYPSPSDSEVGEKAKNSKCYEAKSPESQMSDYNTTDWSEFIEKFDLEYKKGNNLYSTDKEIVKENKASDKLEKSKYKEWEKYFKDVQPTYDILQSPIEQLMKEIKSAYNSMNTMDSDMQSNMSIQTDDVLSEKGQKKRKMKKGRKGGWKKKTSRKTRG